MGRSVSDALPIKNRRYSTLKIYAAGKCVPSDGLVGISSLANAPALRGTFFSFAHPNVLNGWLY